ncbi:BnaC02g06460D [Brassica napus]|uniref:(rape) hypothetical protein n=1 Tax=Brassica napus TaxID=3708 RepID=A0A078HJT9_BRANA|nr:unnamed protein product [Brassica napus]CDY38127.1 BnaC02g06460D [Brassica napus]
MFTTQPEKTSFIEEVARLVSQKGLETERTLMAVNNDNDKKFSFLLRSDPCHAYYQHKLNYYRKEAQVTRPHAPATTTTHDCSVAMFVARYGENFRRDLMETVFMNPLFEFLRPTDCKCSSFFTSLLRVYSTVIMPSDMLWNGDDSTAYALEFFSSWRSSRTVRRRLLLICMGLWVVLTVLVT